MSRRLPLLLAALVLALPAVPAGAAAATGTGGASGDFADGGAQDPGRTGALSFGAPAPLRPVARVFSVAPRTLTEGAAPRISVRIDHAGARRVAARIVVLDAGSGRVGARIDLGRVRTGRVLRVAWPARTALAPGSYVVRLHAKDPDGATLARAARATGKATLVVKAKPRPVAPKPQPQPPKAPAAPAPAPVPATGGVFPVAGPHSYGGPDGRFGAGRPGHIHQGQDLSAAAGTPVVAPVAGTIAYAAFQAGGAGNYVVLNADDGRAMFFAHLQTGSVVVSVGQEVAAGSTLGRVGSTGASSGPHLHFEIWEGGWRPQGGKPIDPLAQLRAWDR